MAKLTKNQAVAISKRAIAGENQFHLAAEFGISRSAVNLIKRKKTWNWIHESRASAEKG